MSQQPSQPAVPIVNIGIQYAFGASVSRASNTELVIHGGQVRDSTNTFDIVISNSIGLFTTFVGAGGLDTGTISANTMYYVYVLYDPTNTLPPSAVLSLSYTGPILPSVNGTTYGAYRIIGMWATDGSSNLMVGNNVGYGTARYFQYSVPQRVLNGSVATSGNISLGAVVPVFGLGKVFVNSIFSPASVSQTLQITPYADASNLIVINGLVASAPQNTIFPIVPGFNVTVPTLSFTLGTAPSAQSMDVIGFEYNV